MGTCVGTDAGAGVEVAVGGVEVGAVEAGVALVDGGSVCVGSGADGKGAVGVGATCVAGARVRVGKGVTAASPPQATNKRAATIRPKMPIELVAMAPIIPRLHFPNQSDFP